MTDHIIVDSHNNISWILCAYVNLEKYFTMWNMQEKKGVHRVNKILRKFLYSKILLLLHICMCM